MTTPFLDIILPVWSNPVEIRSCLVSLLPAIKSGARLLLINNGCNRETELLLEEFSDPLGEQAIYMTMPRNIGFVPAINHGLRRSDADWAMILRPCVTIADNDCRQWVEAGAASEKAGILVPFTASKYPELQKLKLAGFHCLETATINFDLLVLSRRMRQQTGEFSEELDGGKWCLKDYYQRAHTAGFKTCLMAGFSFTTEETTIFGSEERRRIAEENSRIQCQQKWGVERMVAVYQPETEGETLCAVIDDALTAARLGHRLHLFLLRKQYREAIQAGAHLLHTNIRLHKLPLLSPLRTLVKRLLLLSQTNPDLLLVGDVTGFGVSDYPQLKPCSSLKELIAQTKVSGAIN